MIGIGRTTTPIGTAVVAARGGVVVAAGFDLEWIERRLRERFPDDSIEDAEDPAGAVSALRRYVAGDLDALEVPPVDPGGNGFRAAVWEALRRIPAGQTVSYGALAMSLGRPRAARAVGAACGSNPIWPIIPCHRVVASDGSLHGYGGGLARKRWLLEHERAIQPTLLD